MRRDFANPSLNFQHWNLQCKRPQPQMQHDATSPAHSKQPEQTQPDEVTVRAGGEPNLQFGIGFCWGFVKLSRGLAGEPAVFYIHTYILTYLRTDAGGHLYAFGIHTYVSYTYTSLYIYVQIDMCVHTSVSKYRCIHTYIYIYTHIHMSMYVNMFFLRS